MLMAPMTVLAASADRQALVPMAAGYLILMSALAGGLRRLYRPPATQAEPGQPPGPSPAGSRPRSGWDVQARHVIGTVVFALWLWAGWHIFVRRWQFLLRA